MHRSRRRAHREERRLRRPVDIELAGLPGGERGLVLDVEEQQPDHVRLAEGHLHRLGVHLSLCHLVDGMRRRGLRPGVEDCLRSRQGGLDPELVVEDRQGRPALRRAVERSAEEPDELLIVGKSDRRAVRVREVGPRGRGLRVRVEREGVHDRHCSAACSKSRSEIGDERRGGVRVAASRGLVDAARRERTSVDGGMGPHELQRVVGGREELLIRGRGDVLAARPELRQPEAIEVRLVADDDVVQQRIALRDVRRERREVGAVLVGERRDARTERVEREHDADAGELSRLHGIPERDLVEGTERLLTLRPRLRQPDRVEAGELRLVHLGLGERVVLLLPDVVRGADHHERPARPRGVRAGEKDQQNPEKRPHRVAR